MASQAAWRASEAAEKFQEAADELRSGFDAKKAKKCRLVLKIEKLEDSQSGITRTNDLIVK